MKREFLQSFKIGEQSLPKEIIDAIMEENGRDINAAKAVAIKPYADFDAILAENESLKQQQALCDGKTAAQWKELHDHTVQKYETQVDGMKFGNMVENTILRMGGKNVRAICSLLDLAQMQESENRQQMLSAALESLQKTDGYLFGNQTPPPYAGGTGTQHGINHTAPQGLAGALREKFERK